MRTILLFHIAALVLLVAGCLMPWVAFDSPELRAANFAALEGAAGGDIFPPAMRQFLARYGFVPGLPPERVWSLLGRDDHPEHFDLVAGRERLFSWDLLVVPTSVSVKAAVVTGYAAVLLGLVLLFIGRLPADLEDEGQAAPASSGLYRAAAVGCPLAALLVIVTAPLLDSFGYVDEWGLAWLDILSGARATVAPRLLIPLGLFVLAVVALAALQMIDSTSPPDVDEDVASWRWGGGGG